VNKIQSIIKKTGGRKSKTKNILIWFIGQVIRARGKLEI
jgi:hypothetical protein